MRGTRLVDDVVYVKSGIIPAHAGNTSAMQSGRRTPGDHPRACGEHLDPSHVDEKTWGSSPRMRGTHLHKWHVLEFRGIIPAHAGNTPSSRWSETGCRDHPRACGEHLVRPAAGKVAVGSSPRMRGTPHAPPHATPDCRIIPAHAGNTNTNMDPNHGSGDHPRACGEHELLKKQPEPGVGSSPRMRGTLCARDFAVQPYGIIPAHAGNTYLINASKVFQRDHPRACGEHRYS